MNVYLFNSEDNTQGVRLRFDPKSMVVSWYSTFTRAGVLLDSVNLDGSAVWWYTQSIDDLLTRINLATDSVFDAYGFRLDASNNAIPFDDTNMNDVLADKALTTWISQTRTKDPFKGWKPEDMNGPYSNIAPVADTVMIHPTDATYGESFVYPRAIMVTADRNDNVLLTVGLGPNIEPFTLPPTGVPLFTPIPLRVGAVQFDSNINAGAGGDSRKLFFLW